jgi:hypothetical protein
MASYARKSVQQISYIAPAAPARRRAATADLPAVRPEFGFTPRWYAEQLHATFSSRWHLDPEYRRSMILQMRKLLRQKFPGCNIGASEEPDQPLDLLTGVYGGCIVPALYGLPIVYDQDQWPNCQSNYRTLAELEHMQMISVMDTPIVENLLEQMEWISRAEGMIVGHLNWQGVLNNGQRLLGPDLFLDMLTHQEHCRTIFSHICQTMTDAAMAIEQKQMQSGFDIDFFTVSNCSVNLVSPALYEELLLPFDQQYADAFPSLAIHNCAWKADPYFRAYSKIKNVGYIDMGIESDMARAKELFPSARRAVMYTPMDFQNKSLAMIKADLGIVAEQLAPCDIIFADLDVGVDETKIKQIFAWCQDKSSRLG